MEATPFVFEEKATKKAVRDISNRYVSISTGEELFASQKETVEESEKKKQSSDAGRNIGTIIMFCASAQLQFDKGIKNPELGLPPFGIDFDM